MRLLPLFLLFGCAPALAQTPCQSTGGPDLVVADVSGVANYGSSGNLEALALGKVYCNVGALWANCSANTNQHPIAAPGLFRLQTVAGAQRFEQVGVGWCFHSSFALSGSTCCNDCQSTDGTHVGVHCSDVNTASSSGSQSGLSPRWQVNAFTGSFPYPPANPSWSGSVARRLAIDVADLEATGGTNSARYFGEVLLVSPDEALAGTGQNNASYREIAVTGSASAWNFALLGSTTSEASAIQAWQDADTLVQLVAVQIPAEGLLYLASRVTPLGNGVFHYEYALYNLNSDDGVGSFSLPLPAGASVSSVGFHDVTYRDGDGIGSVNQDGGDWPAQFAAGGLSWSTQSFAANPNANALRWGTLYNFRLDSDAPPSSGTITLGLFKSGASVAVAAQVPGSAGTPSCFGDGSAGNCPCGNFGLAGNGCANSANPAGAQLFPSGATLPDPLTGTDTLVLHASGFPGSATAIYLQGNVFLFPGAQLGDGIRCAAGLLRRIGVVPGSGGASQYPGPGDLSISARSAQLGDVLLGSGAQRVYQVWYRDPLASFCPPPTGQNHNVTNALLVGW
ncbi:MAG: hypothetical protein IPJ19_10055 [Planctomycetes bacterium]|nr:hypothetical protein [Planctomycetota bacterium]